MDDRRPGHPRLDPAAVRRLLPDADFRPRHALSQNFLADVEVLERILDEASPAPGRRILEIGPGLGILTGGLLDAGTSVTAVELDSRLAGRLREHWTWMRRRQCRSSHRRLLRPRRRRAEAR